MVLSRSRTIQGSSYWVLSIVFILLSFFLLSCSTLPKKQDGSESFLVLIVENGGGGAGGMYSTAAPFLLSTLSSEPLRLKSGMNFIKLPAGTGDIRLRNLYIGSPDNLEMPDAKGYLGYVVTRPDESSVVLVAKKLRYFVRMRGNTGQMVFETIDLSENETSRIVNGWKEEQRGKVPVEWNSFLVVRPETVLF